MQQVWIWIKYLQHVLLFPEPIELIKLLELSCHLLLGVFKPLTDFQTSWILLKQILNVLGYNNCTNNLVPKKMWNWRIQASNSNLSKDISMITDVLPGVQISTDILLFIAEAGPPYALRWQAMSHLFLRKPRPIDSQDPFTTTYLLLYSKGDKLPKHSANWACSVR